MVYVGMWNILEEFLAGMGWIGIGFFIRKEKNFLGILTIILDTASLLDSLGQMFGIEPVSVVTLNIYIVLAPTWALLMGIILLKEPLTD